MWYLIGWWEWYPHPIGWLMIYDWMIMASDWLTVNGISDWRYPMPKEI